MESNIVDAPFRKQKRLQGYDYSQAGYYFVTICTLNRRNILSEEIVGRADPGAPSASSMLELMLQLSEYGKSVNKYIESIENHYKGVSVDKYVIMPNHVHMIIKIAEENGVPGSSRPTNALIPTIIAALKKMVNRELGQPIWQQSYHDHIIRDEADYLTKWNYIDSNPARWVDDEYFVKS